MRPKLLPFSGSDGVSALRWLRALGYDIAAYQSPSQYLATANSLLVGDAARWADQHPRVKRILMDDYISHADSAHVEIFEKALEARFPPIEPMSMEEAGRHLSTLRQGPSEHLEFYYRRAERLLHALGGVDRKEAPLTVEEEIALRKVGDAFVLGLGDDQVRARLEDYGRQFVREFQNDTLGLEELWKAAEVLEEKRKVDVEMARRAFEVARAARSLDWASSQSSPPELSFSGFFGSLGDSHDSFTRSEYGVYRKTEGTIILGPKGLAVVSKGLGEHWIMDENTTRLPSRGRHAGLPSLTVTTLNSQPTLRELASTAVPSTSVNSVATSSSSGTSLPHSLGGFDCLSMFGRPTAPVPTPTGSISSNFSGQSKSSAANVHITERPKCTFNDMPVSDVTLGPSGSCTSKPKVDAKVDAPSNPGRPVSVVSTKSTAGSIGSLGTTRDRTSSAGSKVLSAAADKATLDMAYSRINAIAERARSRTPKSNAGESYNAFSTPGRQTITAPTPNAACSASSFGTSKKPPSAPSSKFQPPAIPQRKSSLERAFDGAREDFGPCNSGHQTDSPSSFEASTNTATASSSKAGPSSQINFASTATAANGLRFTFPTVPEEAKESSFLRQTMPADNGAGASSLQSSAENPRTIHVIHVKDRTGAESSDEKKDDRKDVFET